MNDLSGKKVFDKVYCVDGSEWTVDHIFDDEERPLQIVNLEEPSIRIMIDGRKRKGVQPTFFSEPVRVIPAQGECDFSGYQVDDGVFSENGTRHTIFAIDSTGFRVSGYMSVNLSGKYNGVQTFFHAPPNLVASNPDAFRIPQHIAERKKTVDWANVPIDTLVEVDFGSMGWERRYFAGMMEHRPSFFNNGATSQTYSYQSTAEVHEIRLANEENTK